MHPHLTPVLRKSLHFVLTATAIATPLAAWPIDTDIFSATSAIEAPNVLIVLDNTSNWSRNDQKFPDGNGGTITQGQAEVAAIKAVISGLPGRINVGMLEFVTGGPATDNGGYIRQAIVPMGADSGITAQANRAKFSGTLDLIFAGVTTPTEKTNSGQPYGNLMLDAYNYYGGYTPNAKSADVVAALADTGGYSTTYSRFKSPLSAAQTCNYNYIIFLGNPPSRGPVADDAANLTSLSSAGGSTSQLALKQYTSTTVPVTTDLGYSAACYTAQPTGTPTEFPDVCPSSGTTYDSCSYGSKTTPTLDTCSAGTARYSIVAKTPVNPVTSVPVVTSDVQNGVSQCYNKTSDWTVSDTGGLPALVNSASTVGLVTTTVTYGTPGYALGAKITPNSCPGGRDTYKVIQTATKTTTVITAMSYASTTLGNSEACYLTLPTGAPTEYTCPSGASCSYSAPTTTAGVCATGKNRYSVSGSSNSIVTSPTNAIPVTDTATYNADEWARFMNLVGVPVAGSTTRATVQTYAIDVYGLKPDATQTSLLKNMAAYGGGGYFAATNAPAIKNALQTIFGEIQATNSTFASAALPISATQRSQNDNQVFLGMFRPDAKSFPRWVGNLKQYKLGTIDGGTDLVDAIKGRVISTSSGFVTPCAQSFWTTDSGNYWANISGTTVGPRIFRTFATASGSAWTTQGDFTGLAKGGCSDATAYSDLPDGPVVEKGGVAEVLRKSTATRNVLTLSSDGKTLVDFSTSSATASTTTGVNTNIVNFIRGQDVTGEIDATASTANRPSIHGAVIHSRPLPVDFGSSNGVRVFYGSNDGTFRGINATSGAEDWAFVAPESLPYLQRLLDNSPRVQSPYPTPPGQTATPGSAPDFYFDGSSGLYQASGKVWIYPTMRRGGRMIYALDVSTPTAPKFLWKAGCSSLINDTNCTTDMSGIGQTWSTPNVALLSGYSTSTPLVIVGGGYDACEDADSAPSAGGFCNSPKGARIYILNGETGSVVRSFPTDRSVAGDVSLIDIDQNGTVDAAYAADTGGNLYRISFTDTSFKALSSDKWTITKVAHTSGGNRKFLFAPAVLPYKNNVYVAIASGDREHPTAFSYPYTTPVTNRAYVYLDNPAKSDNNDLDAMLDRTSVNSCGASSILPGDGNKGYFINLTDNGIGEQAVTSAIVSGGVFIFSTNRPVVNPASCSTSLGEARGYLLNLLNGSGAIGAANNANCGGSRSSIFVGGGLPPSPVAGVVTIDGVTQNIIIGAPKKDGSTSTPIGGQRFDPSISGKRTPIYWRTTTDTR
ncbi:MAG: hypothetical protein H7315_18220 [Herminiimonas sp.]|nr:hypothetical protein [Herminiimonas sp.]